MTKIENKNRRKLRDELKILAMKSLVDKRRFTKFYRAYRMCKEMGQVLEVPVIESDKLKKQGFLVIGFFRVDGNKYHELVNRNYFLKLIGVK